MIQNKRKIASAFVFVLFLSSSMGSRYGADSRQVGKFEIPHENGFTENDETVETSELEPRNLEGSG